MKLKFHRSSKAVTILEIMVSLVIFSIILALSVAYVRRGTGRTQLVETGKGLVGILRRAQAEANSKRSFRGVCFKQDTGGSVYAQLYIPQLGSNGLPTNDDCGSGEVMGARYNFKSYVGVCASCDANIGLDKSIFFNALGFSTAVNGVRTGFEICLIHSKMDAGTRAREVEVTSMGLVKLLGLTDAGSLTGVSANADDCI